MRKGIFITGLFFALALAVQAQEFNARVTINTSKIQSPNTQVITSLQNSLTEFINNKKWTDGTFAANERIDCTITIIVNEQADNTYKCEIQIQARRPVYNSAYTTTTFNFRDTQFDFEYDGFSQLEYNERTLNSNLTAVVTYYLYMILGFDFDSFSPKGGTPFFQSAMQIVNLAQSQPSWNGWKAFDSNRNRHALATAITETQADGFRDLWYTYHRKGLDEMAANADRGRNNIIAALPALKELQGTRPNSVLLQVFADAKLDEVVSIYSKATTQEKQEGLTLLSNLYPTMGTKLEPLKK